MKRHRLRAPSADGALLAEPPLEEAGPALAGNLERLGRWDHDFQGRPATRLRAMVRAQVLERARQYLGQFGLDVPAEIVGSPPEKLVVAGHQPELFHAGVWVKNFALAEIAKRQGAAGLNLVVDNDIPKGSTIRVPFRAPGTGELRSRYVEYDEGAGEVPYEDLRVRDESRFESFRARVVETLDGLVPDPLIHDYWPRVLRFQDRTERTGLRFALARRELEAAWGVANAEVPLSAACETEGFLWFTSHLLAQLTRFQQVHNEALIHYRRLHGIRSSHHPVPALGREGDWLEAPFWAWRAGRTRARRRPLLARQLTRTMELRIAGEDEPFLEIPLSPDHEACCAVEALLSLPAQGVRLRSRALTTTLFARLLLGDVFLHGIGGAKYDELTDEIIRTFFGIEPPTYLTLSMTVWLGLPDDPAVTDELHEVDRSLRDLTFNPDRHLSEPTPADAAPLVEAKRRALGGPVETRRQRVARFREIRRCNEAMQTVEAIRATRAELASRRTRIIEGLRRNAVAHSREYAFVLHSARRLREAFGRLVPEAFRG